MQPLKQTCDQLVTHRALIKWVQGILVKPLDYQSPALPAELLGNGRDNGCVYYCSGTSGAIEARLKCVSFPRPDMLFPYPVQRLAAAQHEVGKCRAASPPSVEKTSNCSVARSVWCGW